MVTKKKTSNIVEYPTIMDIVKVISNTDIINYVNSHPDFTVAELHAYFKKQGYSIF